MDRRVERETSSSSKQHRGGEVNEVRKVIIIIMVVLVVVMLGYLMIWIIMPTNLYKTNWKVKMSAYLQSTYFGTHGVSLLIFVFPVLFIAVLGSVYLHYLGMKCLDYEKPRRKEEKSGRMMASWRRPVLVRGPLGIVSGIELSFLMMFIAFLAWSLTTYLHVGYSKIKVHGGQRWLYKWESTIFRLGLTGNICLSLLFYPVTRGSSILPLLGLTSEGSIKYHIWLGHLTMALFTAHGLGYIPLWAVAGEIEQAVKWAKTDISNVAGEISLFCGLILWATTFPRIRRNFFELFFYTHHLYILFILFFFFHVGIGYAFYMLPGFYLFLIDRYLRFLQSSQRVRLLSSRVLPSDAFELNFAKSAVLTYNPGSIIFINVPSISRLQWHPFTVTSSSNLEQDKLSVVVKVEGRWTRKLYDLLSSSSISDHRLQVSVEGPYGPPSNHFLRHDTLVLVSGGSGITPFISIIQELLFMSANMKCQTPKIILISSFKKSVDLSMLNLLIPLCGTTCDLSNLDMQIKAYVTREKEQSHEYLKQPRTVWFKPNTTDAPISPTLGKNNWLWLGAIIASSFIGFLVLMGLLTRYYIYPIDHNTNDIFPQAARAILYLVILCGCVALAASAAFLRNKKRNAMETKQITNMEGITPQATPESRFYNADRELESLPHQSILQSTQVHYGQRPDLKKILFESKGASVGVVASGPRGLRHEVAAICGAGLADNLHFESISFSW